MNAPISVSLHVLSNSHSEICKLCNWHQKMFFTMTYEKKQNKTTTEPWLPKQKLIKTHMRIFFIFWLISIKMFAPAYVRCMFCYLVLYNYFIIFTPPTASSSSVREKWKNGHALMYKLFLVYCKYLYYFWVFLLKFWIRNT